MPVYTIGLPDGRETEIEAPEGATEADVLAFVEQQWNAGAFGESAPSQPQQPKQPVTEDFSSGLYGLGETALAMGTGVAGSIAGGLYGLARAPFVGTEQAAQDVEDVQRAMTYEPSSESAQAIMGGISRPLQEIEKGQRALGETALDATGSPALATASYMAPDILSTLFGLKGLQSLKSGTQLKRGGLPTRELKDALNKNGIIYEELSPEVKAAIPDRAPVSLLGKDRTKQVAESTVEKELAAGGKQAGLAPYKLFDGKKGDDRAANEAIRQGVQAGDVQAIKTASPDTKKQMETMLQYMERLKANSAAGVRPSDIVGQSVAKRLEFIANKSSDAGARLNKIATEKLKGKPMNPAPVEGAFVDAMQNLDIKFDMVDGKPVFDFVESAVRLDPSSQRIIKSIGQVLSEGATPDALRFHNLKRQLDMLIDYRKSEGKGVTPAAQGVLRNIRRSLNQSLREVDPEYARVNDILSRALGVFEQMDNATASRINVRSTLDDPRAVGQEARKLFTNYQSRIELENALSELDKVVKEFSATGKEVGEFLGEAGQAIPKPVTFNDSVYDLANFANILDDSFGAAARGSLQGRMESAVKHGSRAATQGTTSAVTQGIGEKAMDMAKKFQGIDEYNRFRSLEELLKQGGK